MNNGTGKCLDTLNHKDKKDVGFNACHGLGGNQVKNKIIFF